MYCASPDVDRSIEDSMTVAAMRTSLHMEPSTPEAKLRRVTLVYDVISTPAGYRLMRANRDLAVVVGRKTRQLMAEALSVKETNPDLSEECEEVLHRLAYVRSRCGAIMDRRYDFRPVLRAPRRYRDEY